MLKAVCRDANPEWFYADDNRSQDALDYCAACPVVTECLTHALRFETAGSVYGIWGATTASDRERMMQTANQVDSARIDGTHGETAYVVKSDSGLKLELHASTLTSGEIQNLLCGDPIYIGRIAFYLTSH